MADGTQAQAAFAPLEDVLRHAEDTIEYHLTQARNQILEGMVIPGLVSPCDVAIHEIWMPLIEQVINESLRGVIEEVWKDLPEMIGKAIDEAVGCAGKVVLPQLSRNEYICALPCNCPPGCPGCLPSDDEDDDDDCY